MKKNKTVYIALTADSLHHGHMNLIEKARKYGDIIIGLLTDKAVAEHKRLPYLNYEQRKRILIINAKDSQLCKYGYHLYLLK